MEYDLTAAEQCTVPALRGYLGLAGVNVFTQAIRDPVNEHPITSGGGPLLPVQSISGNSEALPGSLRASDPHSGRSWAAGRPVPILHSAAGPEPVRSQNAAPGPTAWLEPWGRKSESGQAIASRRCGGQSWSMTEVTTGGVRVKIEIWYDQTSRKITFSNVDQDFGRKGLIGSFIPGSAAEKRAQELLERHGKLPSPPETG